MKKTNQLKSRITVYLGLLIAVLIIIPIIGMIILYLNLQNQALHHESTGSFLVSLAILAAIGLFLIRRVLKEINQTLDKLHEHDTLIKRMGRIQDQLINETYVFDAATLKFIQANRAALENSGYTIEQLGSMTPMDIKPEYNYETFQELLRPLRTGEAVVKHFITSHRRSSGLEYPVDVRVQYFPEETPPVFVAVVEDISERLKFESALHANQAKTRFLTLISHELRTPLHAITGFAQLLQVTAKDKLDEEEQKQLDHILQASWHLLELINRILEFSRIELDNIPWEAGLLDSKTILEEVLPLITPLASKRHIKIHTEDQGYTIYADRTRLKQVVINLLSNAVKYNRENGDIYIRLHQQPNDMIRISIADTGHGLDEKQKEKIFQPFERLGQQNSEIEGTGLGLVVSKRIVEKMGGRIGVESTPGQGSQFWVELPTRPLEK